MYPLGERGVLDYFEFNWLLFFKFIDSEKFHTALSWQADTDTLRGRETLSPTTGGHATQYEKI